MSDTTAAAIATLNDRFRRGDPKIPGQTVITRGVVDLLHSQKHAGELKQLVQTYDAFDEHSDPHGEHDFGVFEFRHHKLFWRIDYYDLDFQGGSWDPTDLTRTNRVLTIMLANEY